MKKSVTIKRTETPDFTKNAIVSIYESMLECVNPDNIEDEEFVIKKLNEIETLKIALPEKLIKNLDRFVEQTIEPVLEPCFLDTNLPDNIRVDDEGKPIIDTDDELYSLIGDFFTKCQKLEGAIKEFGLRELRPYLI